MNHIVIKWMPEDALNDPVCFICILIPLLSVLFFMKASIAWTCHLMNLSRSWGTNCILPLRMHKALMGWINLSDIILWILDFAEVKESNSRLYSIYICRLNEYWTVSAVCVEAHRVWTWILGEEGILSLC